MQRNPPVCLDGWECHPGYDDLCLAVVMDERWAGGVLTYRDGYGHWDNLNTCLLDFRHLEASVYR